MPAQAHSLSALPISASTPQSNRGGLRSSSFLGWNLRQLGRVSSFARNELSIGPLRSRFVPKRQATVLLSLPTENPERASTEKLPKWSVRAMKSFAMGELEARKLKYPNTGTEALLMGILVEAVSVCSVACQNVSSFANTVEVKGE